MTPRLPSTAVRALVVGGSAGAVGALFRILPSLPEDFPLPVIIVVHLPPDGENLLPALLDKRCQIAVKEAEDKEPIRPGTAYVAPPNYHLLVEPDFLLSLSQEEPVLYSRPSIDVLFESAADAYGDAVAGLILTGASADGARGLRALSDAGGRAYVQNPATAEASLMPQAALDACPAACMVELADLAALLQTELVQVPT